MSEDEPADRLLDDTQTDDACDGREALERELFWAIALGGCRWRIEQLKRILTPAANDVSCKTKLGPPAS